MFDLVFLGNFFTKMRSFCAHQTGNFLNISKLTFVCSPLLMPSMACQTLITLFLGHPVQKDKLGLDNVICDAYYAFLLLLLQIICSSFRGHTVSKFLPSNSKGCLDSSKHCWSIDSEGDLLLVKSQNLLVAVVLRCQLELGLGVIHAQNSLETVTNCFQVFKLRSLSHKTPSHSPTR